ncbi:MAG TPA: alpha/beta hydrolase [Mycobacterium sp.]|nr:alpha/beta hydrolase [Mycobacterium sp.]
MGLQIAPEVAIELGPVMAAAALAEPPAVGDVATRRLISRLLFEQLAAARPPVAGVQVQKHSLTTGDGAQLGLSWYHPADSAAPGGVALYLHGGGMIFGLSELGALYDAAVRAYVAASGVPMLMVDYRTAPEFPHPAPVEDCYAALVWLARHADSLPADPARLAVMGDSAGGGLAAAVCLLCRDRGGPAIAQQLLIYPMLDDRTSAPDAELLPFLTWTHDDNLTGWGALLGEHAGTANVAPYAAPARATDLSGLPAAYLDVGDLDLFRDEDIAYARRLADAGVQTELHVHPGCPHAFEALAPNADVSRRAIADRVRRLRAL